MPPSPACPSESEAPRAPAAAWPCTWCCSRADTCAPHAGTTSRTMRAGRRTRQGEGTRGGLGGRPRQRRKWHVTGASQAARRATARQGQQIEASRQGSAKTRDGPHMHAPHTCMPRFGSAKTRDGQASTIDRHRASGRSKTPRKLSRGQADRARASGTRRARRHAHGGMHSAERQPPPPPRLVPPRAHPPADTSQP